MIPDGSQSMDRRRCPHFARSLASLSAVISEKVRKFPEPRAYQVVVALGDSQGLEVAGTDRS